MLNIDSNLEIAIEASIMAGKAIMEVYNTEFSVEHKSDNSPLTQADMQANAIINNFLLATGIPIISEENKQLDYSIRKEWKKCWVVDPVDGTKEFIKKNGEFTVNIALVSDGKPEIGVIYVPASKTLYYADVNKKFTFKSVLKSHIFNLDEIVNSSTPLKPSLNTTNLAVVGSRSHMNDETLEFIENLKDKGNQVTIVSKGSSLKFCLVAEGNADLYPRFAPTMEWDTAAGQAICNAVGVEVISQENQLPLRYNKENLLNPWFIVSK